ncbi:MAG: hypothetical protein DBX91_05950 [Subdoligranulum variabile]|nr:MAG: hypothetical protein DBX91_05950 [Subdoligranulum variabile]
MKFRTKITAAVVCLLAATLSLVGVLVIGQAFAANLATARMAAQQRHSQLQDALLKEYYTMPTSASPYPQGLLSQSAMNYAAQHPEEVFALYRNGSLPVYSALPQALRPTDLAPLLAGSESAAMLWQQKGQVLLLQSTPLPVPEHQIVLITASDLTPVFRARTAQLFTWLIAAAAALALGSLVCVRVSARLTAPLARLERASRAIAAGEYGSRTRVNTDDEIGALSAHFDAMAHAVQERIEALDENLHREKEFVAAFTHELKTPMTTMMGYADWLRAGSADAAAVKEAADYIYHETHRLEEFSFKLLALLQLEHREPERLPVSDRALFAAVQRSLGRLVDSATVEYCPSGCVLCGDKSLLQDLLLNLVRNARTACRELPEGRVTVTCREENGRALLTVQDNGCGIPEKDLARLTEPFYMVDKSRSRRNGGSGIGLALCRRIAELHGAVLDFQSTPGQGTRVSLLLPLAEKEASHETSS